MIKDNGDIYYYEIVNKGLFKKKEIYIIDMYTEKVYSVNGNNISEY